jgi:predicted Zn-dependent peptidase
MVHQEALVTDISVGCGLFGAPLDARDPDTLTVTAMHSPEVSVDRVLGTLDEEIEKLAVSGPQEDELTRVAARWAASLHREHDRIVSRTLAFGAAELLHGRAELASELPDLINAVTPDQVAAAAKSLRPDSRAVLIVPAAGGTL